MFCCDRCCCCWGNFLLLIGAPARLHESWNSLVSLVHRPIDLRSSIAHIGKRKGAGDQSTLQSRSHRDAPQQQDENHIYRNGCSLVDINMPIKIRLHPSHSTRNHENMNILYLYEHISSCKSLYFCSQSWFQISILLSAIWVIIYRTTKCSYINTPCKYYNEYSSLMRVMANEYLVPEFWTRHTPSPLIPLH